jgi:hypothetical protein
MIEFGLREAQYYLCRRVRPGATARVLFDLGDRTSGAGPLRDAARVVRPAGSAAARVAVGAARVVVGFVRFFGTASSSVWFSLSEDNSVLYQN